MDITIRQAREADRENMYALYKAAMREYIEQIWGWDEAWQRNDFAMAYASVGAQIVELDAGFAGYVQLERTEKSFYIRMMILGPDFRSRGVGRMLINAISQHAFDAQLSVELRVFDVNKRAIGFYLSNGFAIKAQEPPFYLMEKNRAAEMGISRRTTTTLVWPSATVTSAVNVNGI